jgi:hypothetical protein
MRKNRPRVCGNTAPKGIIGFKKEVITGGGRKLHNEELHNLHSSPSSLRSSNQGE